MKLSKAQEKMIISLDDKKTRRELGLCLVEGEKVINTARDSVRYTFRKSENENFEKLVTTESPQDIAGVANIPSCTLDDVSSKNVIIVLDGVQDPGNIGTILRLCLGFDASLILIESADPTNSKVIRSSVGAMFRVPWIEVVRDDFIKIASILDRKIYRLEKRKNSKPLKNIEFENKIIVIAGSEGSGIKLDIDGTSIYVEHNEKLESLNVANALSILLYEFTQN